MIKLFKKITEIKIKIEIHFLTFCIVNFIWCASFFLFYKGKNSVFVIKEPKNSVLSRYHINPQ